MVEALGGRGAFVTEPREIGPALDAGARPDEVWCVNVVLDPGPTEERPGLDGHLTQEATTAHLLRWRRPQEADNGPSASLAPSSGRST